MSLSLGYFFSSNTFQSTWAVLQYSVWLLHPFSTGEFFYPHVMGVQIKIQRDLLKCFQISDKKQGRWKETRVWTPGFSLQLIS